MKSIFGAYDLDKGRGNGDFLWKVPRHKRGAQKVDLNLAAGFKRGTKKKAVTLPPDAEISENRA